MIFRLKKIKTLKRLALCDLCFEFISHFLWLVFIMIKDMMLHRDIESPPTLWLPKAEEYNYWERSISCTLISLCGSQPCHPGCSSHRRPGTTSLLIRTCTQGALQGAEERNRSHSWLPLAVRQAVYSEKRLALFAQVSSFKAFAHPRSPLPVYKGQQARQLFLTKLKLFYIVNFIRNAPKYPFKKLRSWHPVPSPHGK